MGSSLKIHDEATYAFLADVLGELAELSPGPYLHIGGDEALGTDAADYDTFVARVTAMVAGLGKTPVAWHEAGTASGLTPGTIGQYWGYVAPTDGMDEKARGFVRGGGRLIMSPADAIYLDEIRQAGLYDTIWQAFAVLLPVQTVGVMGDGRTYEFVCALRAVTSVDGMTADFYHFDMTFLADAATRIINEVRGINRVVYDVTSKPPATIAWE